MLIKTHFFQDYIDSNTCQEIDFSENYYTFVCDKNKLNIKVEEFYKLYPAIYFFSVHLNYTFSLKGEDLFLEKDDKLYYLIFSKNENVNNWRLGQIFLKKYYFTFNQEKKQIGFYIKNLKEEKQENAENNNNTNNDNKINYNVIILIVVVILLIFELLISLKCDKFLILFAYQPSRHTFHCNNLMVIFPQLNYKKPKRLLPIINKI